MDAVLLYDGYAVRTQSDRYDFSDETDRLISSSGVLTRFKFLAPTGTYLQYQYFPKSSFNRPDVDNDSAKSGYYLRSSFEQYKRGNLSLYALVNSGPASGHTHRFPLIQSYTETGFGFELAKEGDTVTVRRLHPLVPFTHYYNDRVYTFTIPPDSEGVQYKRTDEFPNATFVDDIRNFSTTHSGSRFYYKNFAEYLGNPEWNDLDDTVPEDDVVIKVEDEKAPQESKTLFAKYMSFICFRIYWIHEEALEKLAINDLETIKTAVYEKYANMNETPYNSLTVIDRAIGELMKDWGYLYDSATPIDASQVLPSTPNIEEVVRYNRILKRFHRALRFKDEGELFAVNAAGDPVDDEGNVITAEEDSERRIKYLHSRLSSDLKIIPIDQRIEMLNRFMENKEIDQDDDEEIDELDIIYLLTSITTYDEANQLLDFLLKIRDGQRTNFEVLYYLIDDKRLDRIFIVQWFVDEDNNRQHFINVMFRIWKISKYNFFYVPDGVTPNEDGLSPNAFFLDETSAGGAKYYAQYDQDGNIDNDGAEPILEFETIESDDNGNVLFSSTTTIEYTPEKEFERELITINQKKTTTTLNPYSEYGLTSLTTTSEHGKYHLYQPLCVLGYKADLELSIPSFEPIPAFLFFYAEEFDRLKDIDAAISFGLQVALEIGLFFATGGAGALRHLRHLKHITKINKVRQGTLPLTETVLFWRGLESGSEVVAVTAGMLGSFFDYLSTTENDPQLAQLHKKLSYCFLAITLTSAGKAIFSRRRAVKSADDVMKEIDNLSSQGIPNQLPTDVYDVMLTISNKVAVRATVIINELSVDFQQLANKLLTIKDSDPRLAFEIGEILRRRSDEVIKKFDDNPNFLDIIDDVTKTQRLSQLAEAIEVAFKAIRENNIKRGSVPDIPDGTTAFSKEIPNFSEKTYDHVDPSNISPDPKAWEFIVNYMPRHTLEQLDEIVQHGINNEIDTVIIRGLIVKSYRCKKQVNYSTIKTWMDNYVNFLDRGFPYCFNTLEDFTDFIDELRPLYIEYGLVGDVRIGGSALTKAPPPSPSVPDLDLVMYIDDNRFNALVRAQEKKLDKLKEDHLDLYNQEYEKIEKSIQKSKDKGKIDEETIFTVDYTDTGKPFIRYLAEDVQNMENISLVKVIDDDKMDFNIIKGLPNDFTIGLPPEYIINL